MDGGMNMLGFVLWCILGIFFIGWGMYCKYSKSSTAFWFWANANVFPVNDVSKYNSAMGKLFITFGIILILLGLPLLGGQNSPLIFVSILGTLIAVIGVMIVYTIVIEKKYRLK
jgi:phosphatidylglycerophosphate synthase